MTSLSSSCSCNVKKKESFSDWDEYYRFLYFVENETIFVNVPVEIPLYNVGEEEKWYRCVKCGTVYRLIEPDPPYGGQWLVVEGLSHLL